MDISIFPDKAVKPSETDLEPCLGANSYAHWKKIRDYVISQYPNATEEWNYPGKKYGWSFRIKDKKRAILYFLPRDQHFKVAFIFGKKAMDQVLKSDVSPEIKTDLKNARAYAEGRGIRIDVTTEETLKDIERLVQIKLAH